MKYLPFVFLILITFSISACNGGNDSEVTFDLVVSNSLNSDLELYLSDGTDLTTFESKGAIEARGEATITGLTYDTEYVLITVQPGNDVNNPITEDTFTNSDPNVAEYSITISF